MWVMAEHDSAHPPSAPPPASTALQQAQRAQHGQHVNDSPLDDLGRHDALLRVQVGGGLVDQVHVGRLAQAERDGHTLQLACSGRAGRWAGRGME